MWAMTKDYLHFIAYTVIGSLKIFDLSLISCGVSCRRSKHKYVYGCLVASMYASVTYLVL